MIVSHTVSTSPQSNTRMNVMYAFTNHVGGVTRVQKLLRNGVDTEADALSMYAQIEAQLEEQEGASLEARAEDGEDVLAEAQTPTHTTAKVVVKRLIRLMMRTRNPYLVIALEPLIVYLRTNYTGAQLIAFLDITAEQAAKMNSRINAILDNKSAFVTYDDNAEDID